MALLKLTNTSNEKPIYVNPLHVLSVREYGRNITEIILLASEGSNSRLTVRESPEDVVQQVDDQQSWLLRAS